MHVDPDGVIVARGVLYLQTRTLRADGFIAPGPLDIHLFRQLARDLSHPAAISLG